MHAANVDDLTKRFAAAIHADHLDLLRVILHGGYRSGLSTAALADRVIAPALHHVGDEWAAGRLPVLREHRILQACVSAVYELAEFLRPTAMKHRPVAVGGAPEHDHTILGTLLTKLALADAGWDTVNLGPTHR